MSIKGGSDKNMSTSSFCHKCVLVNWFSRKEGLMWKACQFSLSKYKNIANCKPPTSPEKRYAQSALQASRCQSHHTLPRPSEVNNSESFPWNKYLINQPWTLSPWMQMTWKGCSKVRYLFPSYYNIRREASVLRGVGFWQIRKGALRRQPK